MGEVDDIQGGWKHGKGNPFNILMLILKLKALMQRQHLLQTTSLLFCPTEAGAGTSDELIRCIILLHNLLQVEGVQDMVG